MGAARSCWLLIRADRAPDVKGSLAAAHYCEGPWPSNQTPRTRQTAPTTAPGPVPGATSAAPTASAQDRAGDDAGLPGGGRRPARCARVRRADRLLPPRGGRRAGADPSRQGGARAAGGRASSTTTSALTASGCGELGVDPEAAMAPFVAPIDAFHDRTRPTELARGAGQGLRRRRHRHRLLPRDLAPTSTPRTQRPGPLGAARTWGRPSSRSAPCVRPSPPTRGRRPARAVGPPARRRGALAGAARRGRAGRARVAARRRRQPAGRRPGRAGPDVRAAHRRAHPPDGPARPVRLSRAARRTAGRSGPETHEGPVPVGTGPSSDRCGLRRSADLLLAGDVAVDDDQHGGHDDADDQQRIQSTPLVSPPPSELADEGADEGSERCPGRW